MSTSSVPVRPLRRWLSAAACGVVLAGSAVAADEPKSNPLPAPHALPMVVPTPHTLAQCQSIARENQEAIRAARASLAASHAGVRALNNLPGYANLLSADLPFRKQQAMRGIAVTQADIIKAETESDYDITYLYYSYIYAKQQEQTATDVLEGMKVYYDIAKGLLDAPGGKINQFNLYAIEDAMATIRRLRVEAQTGQPLALAALKAKMGVDQSLPLVPKETELPVMQGTITQELVVELALSSRPELVQAAAGVDVYRLEVCAQDAIRMRVTVPTFASGSDLHARFIPAPLRNGEFRPGGLVPEMPVSLTGKREDRVAKAAEHSRRQDEVYSLTRRLVELEAIQSYLEYAKVSEQLAVAKERFERGKKVRKLAQQTAADVKDSYEGLVRTEAQYGQALAEYLKSTFDHIKALARLDRVTGGALKPAFAK